MDLEKKELFRELNQIYNSRFKTETIGNILYHMPIRGELTSKYNYYTFYDFMFIWRLDCLLDKGLITEQRKNELLELANLYRKLCQELDDVIAKKNIFNESEYDEKCNIICEKMAKIDHVFDNYHLYDAVNLVEVISDDVYVDDVNIDISNTKEFLKK